MLFSSLFYSFYTFIVGAYSYWGPLYLIEKYNIKQEYSNYIFGGISLVTGILGSFFGGFILDKLRKKYSILRNNLIDIRIATKICFYSCLVAIIFCLLIFNIPNQYLRR